MTKKKNVFSNMTSDYAGDDYDAVLKRACIMQ